MNVIFKVYILHNTHTENMWKTRTSAKAEKQRSKGPGKKPETQRSKTRKIREAEKQRSKKTEKQKSSEAKKQKSRKQRSRKTEKQKSSEAKKQTSRKQRSRKAGNQRSRKAKEQRSKGAEPSKEPGITKKNQYGKRNPQKSIPPLEKKSRQPKFASINANESLCV